MRLTDEPMTELNFQRLHQLALLPQRATSGDAGYDLHSVESFSLAPGERKLIATGLAVEIPLGMAGLVLPRSGLALKSGISLVNAPGLIDSGYRGELKVLLINKDQTTPFVGSEGDRIAQLLIVKHETLEPQWSENLQKTERGSGGFGSTGVSPA